MNDDIGDDRPKLGHMWLRSAFAPQSPPPQTESYLVSGARHTGVIAGRTVELYPRSYATGGNVIANLRFALRDEPLDLGVLAATFVTIDPEVVAAWVRTEPSGSYARRAWFFYEYLTMLTSRAQASRPSSMAAQTALAARSRPANRLASALVWVR